MGFSGDVLRRWMDRRIASVDLMPWPSESLLSDGRRELEVVCEFAGTGDGHIVVRDPLFDAIGSAALDSMLGRLSARLWLLPVLLSSELGFRLCTTSPPAMTTGFILSAKKESLLTRLSCEIWLSAKPFERLLLPLRLRTAPIRP